MLKFLKSLFDTSEQKHLLSVLAQRTARPYYPLDSGWGLSFLSTGHPFFVNTTDRNITPWIIMGGHWETNVDQVLCEYAQPGMNVLDIGAHMGYYTVKLASKIGRSGSLLAFEPNPEVNCVCLENIKINGLTTHARVYNFALGDKTEKKTLTRSHSNMGSANLVGDQDADFTVEVEVKRLDDVVPKERAIDLIKLDAEGYEAFILNGAKETLARSSSCAVMIELGLERWERFTPLDQVVPLCGGNGRKMYAVLDDGTIKLLEGDLREFLKTVQFGENYFLVARPQEVEKHLKRLLRGPS
jgi:FkbM family methyltransferase